MGPPTFAALLCRGALPPSTPTPPQAAACTVFDVHMLDICWTFASFSKYIFLLWLFNSKALCECWLSAAAHLAIANHELLHSLVEYTSCNHYGSMHHCKLSGKTWE